MLARRLERGEDELALSPVVDAAALVEMQHALEQVHVSDSIAGYIVDLVTATRGAHSGSRSARARAAAWRC